MREELKKQVRGLTKVGWDRRQKNQEYSRIVWPSRAESHVSKEGPVGICRQGRHRVREMGTIFGSPQVLKFANEFYEYNEYSGGVRNGIEREVAWEEEKLINLSLAICGGSVMAGRVYCRRLEFKQDVQSGCGDIRSRGPCSGGSPRTAAPQDMAQKCSGPGVVTSRTAPEGGRSFPVGPETEGTGGRGVSQCHAFLGGSDRQQRNQNRVCGRGSTEADSGLGERRLRVDNVQDKEGTGQV